MSDNDLEDYENESDFEDDIIQGVDSDQSHGLEAGEPETRSRSRSSSDSGD